MVVLAPFTSQAQGPYEKIFFPVLANTLISNDVYFVYWAGKLFDPQAGARGFLAGSTK